MLRPLSFALVAKLQNIGALAIAALIFGSVSPVFAALDGINDPSFETTPLGALSDSGGVNQWSSFNANNLRFTVTSDVAHTGTQSITNAESSSNNNLLYQFDTTNDPTEILGHTFDYSFWVYYDSTLQGQNLASDSIAYRFDTRDDGFNETPPGGSAVGTILASSLTSKTWTHFTGSFTVPSSTSLLGPLDRVGVTLSNATGKWYADDITLSVEAVPEPSSIVLLSIGAGLVVFGRRKNRD